MVQTNTANRAQSKAGAQRTAGKGSVPNEYVCASMDKLPPVFTT